MKSDPMGMVTKTWTIFNHLGPCYVHSKVLAQEGKRETASRCQTGISNPMADLKLPKGVTYLQAFTAVNAKTFLSETDFGQFCRKHGYLASPVDAWAEWFSKHPDAVDKRQHDAQASAITELKKENARQAREISRKDKALADAVTMLMLSKKAEAIWGEKEN